MPTDNDTKIIEQYKKLPQALKTALFSDDTTEKIFTIGKKNKLTVEQVGILADETGLVILGITKPEDYGANLAKRLLSKPDITNNIVAEVNEKILGPLREELNKLHSPAVAPQAATSPIKKEVLPSAAARMEKAKPAPQSLIPPLAAKPSVPAVTALKAPIVDIKFSAPPATSTKLPTPPSAPVKIPMAPTAPAKPVMDIKPAKGIFTVPIEQPKPATQTPKPPPRVTSWSDIPIVPSREPSAPIDAKNALEKALNPSFVAPPENKIERPSTAPYTGGKDPYREPIE